MTGRSPSHFASPASPNWESRFVIGAVALLSGLTVADRLFAWLIGAFPAEALLWHIRFEYLRPIAVYHSIAERSFGSWSPWSFSLVVAAAGALIALSVLSGIRLARAVSCHLLLIAGVVLAVLCFDSALVVRDHALVGTPSEPYFLIGVLLASIAAGLCLRIHAEYMGLDLARSRLVRRTRSAALRQRDKLVEAFAGVIEPFVPIARRVTVAHARRAVATDRRPRD